MEEGFFWSDQPERSFPSDSPAFTLSMPLDVEQLNFRRTIDDRGYSKWRLLNNSTHWSKVIAFSKSNCEC